VTPASPTTAIAFDATSNAFGLAFVKVYASGDQLIGPLTIPANTARFVGITSGTPIVKVNFSSTLGAVTDTGIDSVRIATYVTAALGDIDGDGNVNGVDLGLLLGAWGGSGLADLNCDDIVDGADLAIVLGAWTG
jgi:hypothetical protein